MVWILSILNLHFWYKGVLGDTDKETFSSISITKNPPNVKLHIQMPYLHTGGVCFQFKNIKSLYIRYRVKYG